MCLDRDQLVLAYQKNCTFFHETYPQCPVWSCMYLCGEVFSDEASTLPQMQWWKSPVPVYSLTKYYTMLLVMTSIQEGYITLNDRVVRWYPMVRVFYNDSDIFCNITIQHLLTHTSGLLHEAPIGNNYNCCESIEDHIYSLDGSKALFYPGKDYSYSNIGYDILGGILEKIYGCSYDKLLVSKVLTPIGITRFDFCEHNRSQIASYGLSISMNEICRGFLPVLDRACREMFFSPELYEMMKRPQNIAKDSISGYGFGVKRLEANSLNYYCISGGVAGQYIIQYWSDDLQFGYLLFIPNLTLQMSELLNTDDFFYNTLIEKTESHDRGSLSKNDDILYHYTVPETRFAGSYISYDDREIVVKVQDGMSFSFDKNTWIQIKPLGNSVYLGNEGVITFSYEENREISLFIDGWSTFGRYFKNTAPSLNRSQIKEYRQFCGVYKLVTTLKPSIVKYWPNKQIILSIANGVLYINKQFPLIHITNEYFEKANHIPVEIKNNKVIIGNIVYQKIFQCY